ncbi:MAG: fatty acid desaturase family protein [Gammaproteobacteria bacterium]|nr:fatty acid desaturase family protein [Gammaproteobacteria bacterium]
MSTTATANLSDYASAEEMRSLLVRSDWQAGWMTLFNLAVMVGAFALSALWLNPLTVLLAVLLLGGRQLGLAVLYHDCAHQVLFKSRWLNDAFGTWLFGGLMNTSLARYRAYHLDHHRHAGTERDPDLGLASAYPAEPASLRRKLTRDLTGRTGFKDLRRQVKSFGWSRNAPFLASHGVMFSLLALAGAPWAYALWWLAYLVAYQVVTRIRFMSEHGVALNRLSADVRENTATTLVSWWERLLIGPNFVNYHLEHHLQAGVPCYRLRRFHSLLKDRGFFGACARPEGCFSNGYLHVLRKAVA